MLRSLAGLVLFGLSVPALFAQDVPVRVAFVTNNPADFWKIVEAGCVAQAKQDRVELYFRRPPTGTPPEQQELIDAAIALGTKAVCVAVLDPERQTGYLNRVAALVPLVTVDNDAPKSQRKVYLGTDNVKMGRAAGKLIQEAHPKGATLALFVGVAETANARDRIQGILAELGFQAGAMQSKDGKYRLLRKEVFADQANPAAARERATTALALAQNEAALCLVGLWAYNPPAILAAVKEQKLAGKVTIIGFDEDAETLRGIDDGHIYGTVVLNPYEFGRRSVEVMAKLARGVKVDLPASGVENIPERIVTKAGGKDRLKASEFAAEIKKHLGKEGAP